MTDHRLEWVGDGEAHLRLSDRYVIHVAGMGAVVIPGPDVRLGAGTLLPRVAHDPSMIGAADLAAPAPSPVTVSATRFGQQRFVFMPDPGRRPRVRRLGVAIHVQHGVDFDGPQLTATVMSAAALACREVTDLMVAEATGWQPAPADLPDLRVSVRHAHWPRERPDATERTAAAMRAVEAARTPPSAETVREAVEPPARPMEAASRFICPVCDAPVLDLGAHDGCCSSECLERAQTEEW